MNDMSCKGKNADALTAPIFEIKRFAVHDGDGIRTTVFFKGCPMKCIWCHNPEGLSALPQLACYENSCVSCLRCVSVCPNSAHTGVKGVHFFDRSKCVVCGECAKSCLSGALELYGKTVTVKQLLPVVCEDADFYRNSGGGVTLSGGECLLYADFCRQLLRKLKQRGISTAVDTCGYIPKSAFDAVMPYTDVFLYDVKAVDEDVHIRCTGRSNRLILDNLMYIDSKGCGIEVRVPFVPGYNDRQMQKTALFLSRLKNIKKVRLLPYHNYAGSKYDALDMPVALPARLPSDKEMAAARALMRSYALPVAE